MQVVSDLADSLLKLATAGEQGRSTTTQRRTIVTPPTPLNAAITAHRRFAFGSLPLDEIKTVKNAFSMTVNDVVMAMCTTALRRWLLDHDGLPDTPIVVAVPVSVRLDELHPANGNQVSVMLAEMPTHVADPRDRLLGVQRGMAEAKEHFDAVPATILQDIVVGDPDSARGPRHPGHLPDGDSSAPSRSTSSSPTSPGHRSRCTSGALACSGSIPPRPSPT